MKRTLAPLFFLLFLGVAFAVAPPEPGMQLYGHVTGALDGTKITAVIGDSTETTVIDGKYGYSPNTFIATRPTTEYNEIRVYIGGTLYTAIPFQSGALKEMNIDATGKVFCGNGTCDGPEDYTTCPLDCEAPTPAGGRGTIGGLGPTAPPEENVPPEWTGEFHGSNDAGEFFFDGYVIILDGSGTRTVTIHEYAGTPSMLECPPLRNVYRYIDVTAEGNYSSGTITIEVNKNWFSENDLNTETATILHCKEGEWEDLGAEQVSETPNTVSFRSGATTFSFVALRAAKNIAPVEEPETGGQEGETPEEAPEQPTPTPTGPETEETGPTGLALLGQNWLSVLGGLLVLLLLGFVYLRRR